MLNLSFLTNNTDTLVKERIEVINRKKGDRIAIIGGAVRSENRADTENQSTSVHQKRHHEKGRGLSPVNQTIGSPILMVPLRAGEESLLTGRRFGRLSQLY